MYKNVMLLFTVLILNIGSAMSQSGFEIDKIKTISGDLELWCIGHGTIMLKLNDFVVHVDPVGREADYSMLPDADLLLITHSHGDHLDPVAISKIVKTSTLIICNNTSASKLNNMDVITLENGKDVTLEFLNKYEIKIEAVPAYNIKHERSPGDPFHKKGVGNGYIINIDGKRVYVAGDTENIPEMSDLNNIDIAYLPMNLPYTMSPAMAASAALSFMPRVLYPYHFGSSDTAKLVELLKDSGIEVRIRNF